MKEQEQLKQIEEAFKVIIIVLVAIGTGLIVAFILDLLNII